MAIYHFSAQIISRGKGKSAIAAASYRSGEKLVDEQTGETKFYKRDVQPEAMILAPRHAPEWVYERNRLWNEVEKIEKHPRAQLAREINVALPVELSDDQQKELICNFIEKEFVNKGMVADIAIHRDDENNPHAHIMLTIRPFNENGEWGNKKKKEYLLDQNGEKLLNEKGKPQYKTHFLTDWDRKETLEKWREEWANYTNHALEKTGSQERITHLSHEDRGLEQLPTIHLGHTAHAMEKEEKQSDRGNINREIERYNEVVIDLQKYRAQKKELEEVLENQPKSKLNTTFAALTDEEKRVLEKAQNFLKDKTLTPANINSRLEQLKKFQERVSRKEKEIYAKGFALSDKERAEIATCQKQRKVISTEQDILQKAITVYKDDFVRKVASQYPNNPEIQYMNFEQAAELNRLNKHLGRVCSISEIEKQVEIYKKVKDVQIKFQQTNELIGKYEKNPFHREKMKSDSEYRQTYEKRKSEREQLEDWLKKGNFATKDKNQIDSAIDLFSGMLQGVQQAHQRREDSERKKSEKPYYRGQKKKNEMELGQ